MDYDLSKITEVVKSGWTGDLYLDTVEAQAAGLNSIFVFEFDAIYEPLTALIEGWPCVDENDGGVLIYTRPDVIP